MLVAADAQRVYSQTLATLPAVLRITPRDGSPSCTFSFPTNMRTVATDNGSAFVLLEDPTDTTDAGEVLMRIDF
jgi:hypothetical protein